MIKKAIAVALCLAAFAHAGAAQDNNWQLLETTTFGAGGFWENGQTVRIDRSFKSGTFSYERKVTAGQSLSVYSAKGTFSALKSEYAPGATVTVTVSVTESGSRSAAPNQNYGRVTLLQGDPEWTRSNWASNKIAATGAVTGQLTGPGGSYLVSPDGFDELTLSGTIPTSGNRMAIVFSFNGMDVLHLYGREGGAPVAVANDAPAGKVKDTPKAAESSETVQEEVAEEEQPAKQNLLSAVKEKLAKDKPEGEKKALELTPLPPKVKYLLLGVLLLAAIFDLIYMFSKPKQ